MGNLFFRGAVFGIVAVGVFGLAVVPANADVIDFPAIFTNVEVPGGTTVDLPKFDPGWGVLEKVTVVLDVTAHAGVVRFDNESNQSATIDVALSGSVQATAPLSLAPIVNLAEATDMATVPADSDGTPDFVGSDAYAFIAPNQTGSDMAMATTGLGSYIAGTLGEMFTVTLATNNAVGISLVNGFGLLAVDRGLATGTVTVRYEYTPEPATALLLGLCGLGLSRRRRTPAS